MIKSAGLEKCKVFRCFDVKPDVTTLRFFANGNTL